MTNEFSKVVRLIETINTTADPDAAFSFLTDYAKGFGLEYVFLGRLTPAAYSEGSPVDFFRSTYPEDWIVQYFAQDYVNIDPVVDYLLTSTRPFKYADSYANLTKAQSAFVRDAETYNMNDGFIIPIHMRGRAPGSVAFASQTPFSLGETVELVLEMLSRVVFRHIENLSVTPREVDPVTVSDREKQILVLVAQGKTNWEVGQIIELSEFSVRDYMKDLSQRLNTNNRTHTVTRALQLGLITI